ncbi:hypothetical protein ACOSQ2_030135 [Xanthoceras sorbifolium]
MENPSYQDQIVEGDKFGVHYGAKSGCERGEVGVGLLPQVDAALALMELANHSCRLHKNKLCTYREDSGANRSNYSQVSGAKCFDKFRRLVEGTEEEGSGKLQKKKRKASSALSLVQSDNMTRNVGKDGKLQETCRTSEGHRLIIKLHKNGHIEACFRNDFDRVSMPSVGCDRVTKKKRSAVQNAGRLVESDDDHFKSRRFCSEPPISSFKKRSSEKVKTDAGFSDDVVAETKPLMKLRSTSLSPKGFSFSIIHFLSAIRIAMVTPYAEDDTLVSGKHLEGNAQLEEKTNLPYLTLHEIVERVRTNPVDPSIRNTPEPLEDLVRGALKIFSSEVAPVGAKGWQALTVFLKLSKRWSWIGPVSFTDEAIEEQVSAEAWGLPRRMLVKLVDSFADWLRSVQDALKRIESLPAPPFNLMQKAPNLEERLRSVGQRKCIATISPCSEELRAYFHMEEALRYSIPERAFPYTAVDGRKSTVAPLRKSSGKPSSRVRDHFMLKADRPPHVTVLCLVRDAAARLPAGMGTRADVCTLVRDSQYIIEGVSDEQVNQVVSRALDRLHYENDPCIQYNYGTKLWVYLHGAKEEEDFEDDGTSNARSCKGNAKE